jgi:hypothetical protein
VERAPPRAAGRAPAARRRRAPPRACRGGAPSATRMITRGGNESPEHGGPGHSTHGASHGRARPTRWPGPFPQCGRASSPRPRHEERCPRRKLPRRPHRRPRSPRRAAPAPCARRRGRRWTRSVFAAAESLAIEGVKERSEEGQPRVGAHRRPVRRLAAAERADAPVDESIRACRLPHRGREAASHHAAARPEPRRDFTRTDPWRVMRIMGEFIGGSTPRRRSRRW